MDKIETRVINPWIVADAEQMMVCTARLTQRGQAIKSMDDFMDLYRLDYKEKTLKKYGRASASYDSEIRRYQCGDSRCVKTVSGADYPAPERGQIYVGQLAI